MTAASRQPVDKVTLYVTHGARLLVYRIPASPRTLLQVPGGTIEPGETLDAAARRELAEETGLTAIAALRTLGRTSYEFDAFGVSQLHARHYIHVTLATPPLESWSHTEASSSLGFGPIEFALFWLPIDAAAPDLGYRFGEMLPALLTSMSEGASSHG